jgi:alkanesulfonate monooxygenase SsuD/methylene tetrahydromethanopterin reductase-like flavin-dependent oxidoreductase (luciferase family)
MADLLEEIEVPDRVGLDAFGMGEHHRAEFLDSAPAIILAAAAARTKAIRLRGWSAPPRQQFDAMCGPEGAFLSAIQRP